MFSLQLRKTYEKNYYYLKMVNLQSIEFLYMYKKVNDLISLGVYRFNEEVIVQTANDEGRFIGHIGSPKLSISLLKAIEMSIDENILKGNISIEYTENYKCNSLRVESDKINCEFRGIGNNKDNSEEKCKVMYDILVFFGFKEKIANKHCVSGRNFKITLNKK